MKAYKIGPMFTPPVVSNVGGPIAALTIGTAGGGTNWPGGSSIPKPTSRISMRATCLSPIGLVEPPAGFTDMRYVRPARRSGSPQRRAPGRLLRAAAAAPARRREGAGAGRCGAAAGRGAAAGGRRRRHGGARWH